MDDERVPYDDVPDEVVDEGEAPDDNLVEGGPTQAGFERSESAVVPPVPSP